MLDRLDTLVVKPTGESGGKGVYIGPRATDEETARQRELVRRRARALDRPGGRVALDHADRDPDGELVPRHVDLRPFAVYGSELRIIPGGLTRVALAEGEMIVNSSRGGGSKDTWVLSDGRPGGGADLRPSGGRALPRDAGDPALDLDRPGTAATAARAATEAGS